MMDYYLGQYEQQCDRDYIAYLEEIDRRALLLAPIGGPETVEDDAEEELPF